MVSTCLSIKANALTLTPSNSLRLPSSLSLARFTHFTRYESHSSFFFLRSFFLTSFHSLFVHYSSSLLLVNRVYCLPPMPATPPPTMDSDDGDLKTNPVIQGLTDTTQELKDEVRGMRAMMLAMQGMLTQLTSALPTTTPPPAPSLTTTLAYPTSTPDARAPLHTPLSRSPIGVVRDVEPRYSAARSLFFRPPEVAPLAPSPTVATSPTEAESHDSIAALRHLRVSPPEKFEGNANERANAKLWLESVVGWMELTATSPGISEHRLILLFASQLKGTALLWYSNVRDRAAREGKVLTLQNYFDEFVQTYDGALSQLAAEQQLRTLVYKRGACKDLTSTAAEFEQLAGRLY